MTGPNKAHFNLSWLLNNKKSGVPCGVSIGHRSFLPKNGTILRVNIEGFGEVEVDLDDGDLLRLASQALIAYQTKHDPMPSQQDVIERMNEWY